MGYLDTNNEERIFSLEVDATAQATFLEMARWTKFLAIMGFITIGLLILGCIGLGVFLANTPIPQLGGMGTPFIATIYLLFGALYVYPVYALYKYSTLIKMAIKTSNKDLFNSAIGYLKGMFKYIGIFTLIIICLYGLILVIAGGALFMRHSL
jgi:hypothetical protein